MTFRVGERKASQILSTSGRKILQVSLPGNRILVSKIAIWCRPPLFGFSVDYLLARKVGADFAPVLSGRHAVSLLKIFHEMAFILQPGGRHDLFDAQKSGLQKLPGALQPEGFEVLREGYARLRFEEVLQARGGEIYQVSQFIRTDLLLKVRRHETDNNLHPPVHDFGNSL